ncbi:MAG: uroporphyrinogen-III C-methyltransferase [Pseudomonadota bacterium]|nr:uroporphyrinogen-III C-methyltransferase [Pseudomonadota bacterium]
MPGGEAFIPHCGRGIIREMTVGVQAKVYLVGAGPGDPDLLTVKALRLLQTADTLVYDRLVSREILELIPETVSRIFVGKASSRHTLSQQEINALLVDLARKRPGVVRLKGGDPFIFGRGGEEALALARNNIPFEVIPGITAAQACAAYAGIPLTHRGLAQGVQFITGHRKDNEALVIDPASVADPDQTLVVYMGLANLPLIVSDLLNAGRAADTPAAMVERGTTYRQRNIVTTIENLQETVERYAIQSPAMLIIGPVVSLAEELNWFMPWAQEMELKYA